MAPPDATPPSVSPPVEAAQRPSIPDSDEAWMRAYQQGDPAGFRKLLERHERPVYRFCLRSLGDKDAAADATQEVFLRVVRNAARWEPQAKFTTWLYTIARNFCVDEVRKRNFRKTDATLHEKAHSDGDGGDEKIDRVVSSTPDAGAVVDDKRLRQAIADGLAALPAEQAEVFRLREYAGLSFKEIAAVCDVGENTLKSRMRYALVGLRRALHDAGLAPGADGDRTGSGADPPDSS